MLGQQAVQVDEGACQGLVVDHAVGEARHAAMMDFQLVENPVDLFHFRVVAAIEPTGIMGLGAGVHFVGVDQHHAAQRGQVLAATMAEALRALLDDDQGEAAVHVRREALLHIARVQQFDAAQFGGAPEMRVFSARLVRHCRLLVRPSGRAAQHTAGATEPASAGEAGFQRRLDLRPFVVGDAVDEGVV